MYIIYKEVRVIPGGAAVSSNHTPSVRWTPPVWCSHNTSQRWRRWIWRYRPGETQPRGRGSTWRRRLTERLCRESARRAGRTGRTGPAPHTSLRPSTEACSCSPQSCAMTSGWSSSSAVVAPAVLARRVHLPAWPWGARWGAAGRPGNKTRCRWEQGRFSGRPHCTD